MITFEMGEQKAMGIREKCRYNNYKQIWKSVFVCWIILNMVSVLKMNNFPILICLF